VLLQEWFGLDSVHWLGSSHAKGLAQQVQALQAVAAAPVNSRRWRCPEVVVYFPSGVSREVAGALGEMGVVVADGPGGFRYEKCSCGAGKHSTAQHFRQSMCAAILTNNLVTAFCSRLAATLCLPRYVQYSTSGT
jgi:hypothetical protein